MATRTTQRLHICVRRTVDWGDEAAFWDQLDPGFAPKVEVWNSTFGLQYHEFRRELRAIAQANLERVEGAVLCPWEEVPDEGLVAPVDDDDWFAPHLVVAIQASASAEVVGLYWPQSALELPTSNGHRRRLQLQRKFPGLPPRWFCATNSYVIRKGSVDQSIFTGHVAASNWFQQNPERIRLVNQRLSLHNRSLASITSLTFGETPITPGHLRRRCRAYARLYRLWYRVPPGLAWSLLSLPKMEALMVRLKESEL
jgi:hypothetical protein